jgi:hypothetical protein
MCAVLCAPPIPRPAQALAGEAVRLGADLVRGVTDVRVQAGTRPSISYRDRSEKQVAR